MNTILTRNNTYVSPIRNLLGITRAPIKIKTVFPAIYFRLILILGIPIPVRRRLYIETTPVVLHCFSPETNWNVEQLLVSTFCMIFLYYTQLDSSDKSWINMVSRQLYNIFWSLKYPIKAAYHTSILLLVLMTRMITHFILFTLCWHCPRRTRNARTDRWMPLTWAWLW